MNEKGFSLVSVMIAAGLTGGLALVGTQVISNLSQGQREVMAMADEMTLRSGVDIVLSNHNFCTASLGGSWAPYSASNPLKFKKTDIDEQSEGLESELYLSSFDGSARTKLKYSATDEGARKVGQLTIESIRLILPNGVGNYPSNTTLNDYGELLITVNKPSGKNTSRAKNYTFPLNVQIETDSSGKSTILSCSSQSSGSGSVNFSTGITSSLPKHSGNKCTFSSPTTWQKAVNIGAGRDCFAMVERTKPTYRYNSMGCSYVESSGWVMACSNDNEVMCRWVCFDDPPPVPSAGTPGGGGSSPGGGGSSPGGGGSIPGGPIYKMK